jgi:hypothetical protein
MKAVKTIVATAVIVFALTTVAMAGVQRLGGGARDDAQAQAAQATGQQSGTVALSAQQFAALLRAAHGDAATAHAPHAHTGTHPGTQAHARTHAHSTTHHADQTSHAGQANAASGATHHRDHGAASTHHGETHDGGSRGGGTHDGSQSGGGCD